MPYYETSQEWLRQSALLLEARPTTTRITTKYHISPAPSRSSPSSRKTKSTTTTAAAAAATDPSTGADAKPAATTTQQPRGTLTLKTYDPRSGVTLKYRTAKAAEVSRLVLGLGRLGRRMAGLPREAGADADELMADAPANPATAAAVEGGGSGSRTGTPVAEGKQGQGQGQAGGKGKKKRGKK